MSLTAGKPVLKQSIVNFLTTQNANQDESQTPAQAIEAFAEHLTNAIDAFVRSGAVITTGTATNHTGTIT